ncbi:MAG: type II toxin-antitoxin system VapC family toxin [Verrucomicrobiales bacterium]|nr:type II toxin-antitoxin system VapC family toxin [Verrucomicrobiota bacterium JB025]
MELIVVLDTNAYSDWRRSGRWHDWIAIADRVVVPVIVLGELYHGFHKGSQHEQNLARLNEFLSEPQVEVMAATRRSAEIYGEFLVGLQQRGTPLPTNDIWIAAMTHECAGRLISRDAHFDRLPQVARVAG